MRRLEARGVDRRQLIYLNFEDDRLLPIDVRELDLILRAHDGLYPECSGRQRYVFFVEVQGVPSWETYLRRLHDTEDARLFVTGSSSPLLSRELATGLRGRSVSFEVFPLSFAEFLRFRGLEHVPYSRASESRMASALEDYLKKGGLPEVVLADELLRPRILKEYVDLVFYRDLVERYGVGNPPLMRLLLRQCLGHPASLLSIHKLYQDFRSQGQALSKDTLYTYLGYLEQSFIVFPLPVAERSLRKQAVNPKKMHTEDLGYLAGEREVDVVVNRDRPEQLINVAYSVTAPRTWAREIAALEQGAARFPQAKRLLVAHEHATRKPPAGIQVMDAWRYFLDAPLKA
jgi:hypothetical protein